MAANETAKTRLQLQGQDPVQRYRGLGHCIATIVRKEGMAALYRGITATMAYQTILLSPGEAAHKFLMLYQPIKKMSDQLGVIGGMAKFFRYILFVFLYPGFSSQIFADLFTR